MADVGYGATITFSSSYFSAAILNIGVSGYSRAPVDVTHSTSTSGWMEFIPSDLKDAGSLEVEMLFDPNDTPPVDGAAETVTLTFPVPAGQSNGATLAVTGFMTDFSLASPIGDKMTATATIKYTGVPVWTDAS